MRALMYDRYDAGPEIADIPRSEPGPDEVLIKVNTAAVNPLDVKLHSGVMQAFFKLELPHVMGCDIAGTAEAIGSAITHVRPGDHVIGRCAPAAGGGFADYAVVGVPYCIRLPAALSMAEGASIVTAGGTAWCALHDYAKLQSGQRILIHAGAGGVGSFAVQFAKLAGAYVIATASGDGVDMVRRLGADEVIDYRQTDFAEAVSGVDVVLDTIGFDTQVRSLGVLRKGGTLVSVVSPPDEEKAKALGVNAIRGFYGLEGQRLQEFVDFIAANKVKIPIDSTFALSDFERALDRQKSGRARGKILLRMDDV